MIFKTTIGTQSQQYEIDNSSTDFVLKQGTFIDSSTNGIHEDARYHFNTIDVEGTINTTGTSMAGIRTDGTKTNITVGKTGFINGYDGIDVNGDGATITNAGHITGQVAAVLFDGADHSKFINTGKVDGGIFVQDCDKISIVLAHGSTLNVGSTGVAVTSLTTAGQTSRLVNHGAIEWTASGGFNVGMGDGDDKIINRGSIEGGISLGGGNDVFDNRGGSLNDGVYGGAGGDVYILDSKVAIHEDVGGGDDIIKTTISMSLSSKQLEGQEIENLVLLGHKNIDGTGNDLANVLRGNAGANHLDGGLGNDILLGGAGQDTFIFKTGDDHDTIADFDKYGEHDKIDLTGWKGIDSFDDVKRYSAMDKGDVVITLGQDELIISDTDKSHLHSADFLFGS